MLIQTLTYFIFDEEKYDEYKRVIRKINAKKRNCRRIYDVTQNDKNARFRVVVDRVKGGLQSAPLSPFDEWIIIFILIGIFKKE